MQFGSTSSIGKGPSRESHPAARKLTADDKANISTVKGSGFVAFASPKSLAQTVRRQKRAAGGFGSLAGSTSGWASAAGSLGAPPHPLFRSEAVGRPHLAQRRLLEPPESDYFIFLILKLLQKGLCIFKE